MNTSLNNLFLSANTYQLNISAKIEDHLHEAGENVSEFEKG